MALHPSATLKLDPLPNNVFPHINQIMTYSPNCAYRVQLNPQFTINDLIKILPYLKELGIDTIYACPYFQIPKGSPNPYLITSPHHFNSTLGSEADFDRFFTKLKELNMAHILDLVPNHMAASVQNRWFYDVLENGPHSKYAHYFDILFDTYYDPLKGKVMLPILPKPYEECIQSGYIKIMDDHVRVGPITLPKEDRYYKLMYCKSAYDVINYRRFFDINELIGLNMQYDDVFNDFHAKVFELINEGKVQGLRIDHPDGLYDPEAYLKKLPPIYSVIEKILQPGEALPNWQTNGTVGYEYLNLLNGLFVNQENEKLMTQVYETFTGVVHKPDEMLYQIKKTVIGTLIQGEINDIVHMIEKECDRPFSEIKEQLTEMLANFPHYRTYINDTISEQDQLALEIAFKTQPESFLRQVFEPGEPFKKPRMRIQQLMPCIMAKSLEDTFLYRYNRLLSLNEVGGSPLNFGTSIEQFHKANQQGKFAFLPSSTHDTKRSEDVRYRISILSEMPHRFERLIYEWSDLNAKHNLGLDKNIEYFIYQTLIGFWPGSKVWRKRKYINRLHAYIKKAMREAKDYTDWVTPNFGYEHNVFTFIEAICKNKPFIKSLNRFVDEIIPLAQLNSLSAIALKLGSPGVFDLYQGTELFDDSLVDPDNRREVNYKRRKSLLKKLKHPKLKLIHRALRLRQSYPELFLKGEYLPLNGGETIAFARRYNEKICIIIAHRFFSNPEKPHLIPLPFKESTYHNAITNEIVTPKLIDGKYYLAHDRSEPLILIN